MAVLFVDGFDHVDDGFELLKWTSYYSSSVIDYGATYGMDSGWGLRITSSFISYLEKTLSASYGTLIIGTYFKVDSLDSTYRIFSFDDSGTIQVSLRVLLDGSVAVYRGTSTLLAQSAAGLVSPATWYNLGLKVTFSQTVGQVTVKLGTTTVINTAANLDTCATANESANQVTLWNNNHNYVYFDHFFVADTSGSGVNDIAPGRRVTTLLPTSDGTSAQFTPSTGSDNYAMVDEAQLVVTSDYNESTTAGHKDLFGFETLSSGGASIDAVQLVSAVNNPDAGTVVMRNLTLSGATPAETEGSDFTLSSTVKALSTVYELEPVDSVAWTDAKVNAAEFGYKLQSIS